MSAIVGGLTTTVEFAEDQRRRLVRADEFSAVLKREGRKEGLCWWCNDEECQSYFVYSTVIDGVEYFFSDCDIDRKKGTHVEVKHKQCSCCGVDCVRHFGNQPNYIDAEGNVLPKYIRTGSNTYFCEGCDWKICQIKLGNTINLNDPFYDNPIIFEWGVGIQSEMKRLRRNKRARELRQERKRIM
jgi:hypothetical protein